ncbi:MAG: YibE/F family protein [Deinococcales bacterium]
MNVGYDHIGSLVNTLVLAYTGSALPLLLLLHLNDFSLQRALNIELVATEVIHTLVGSVGLILAVPLTTFIAALMFKGNRLPMRQGERELHSHHGHHH